MTTLEMKLPQSAPDRTGEAYMTRAEAARYLGLGTSSLAKFAMAGAGPAYCRIGKSVRYPRSILDQWMAQRMVA